uniref:Uncharacterized protein n=1 Tax=Oncorhynchus kisutch TaxID=8019 RepID=A0A8C7LAE5_ONCKI
MCLMTLVTMLLTTTTMLYPVSPQELHRRSYEGAPESAKTKALQTVIEMKIDFLYNVRNGNITM